MEIKNHDYSEQLKHFGVLGMKWGKHKSISPSQRITQANKKKQEKKEYDKSKAQFYKDTYLHPIKATTSQMKVYGQYLKKDPGYLLNPFAKIKKEHYDAVNKDVAEKITKEKERKAMKKQAKLERKAERIAAQDKYDKALAKSEARYKEYSDGFGMIDRNKVKGFTEADWEKIDDHEAKLAATLNKEWAAINDRYKKKIGKR